jgi:mRNA interferase MazF
MTSDPKNLVDRGDIVWVDFRQSRGSEQDGERPAVVLTSRSFHEVNVKAIVCPITSNLDPWPTKVPIPPGLDVTGAILVDQVRTVDRRLRGFRRIGKLPESTWWEVSQLLAALLGLNVEA